MRIPVPPDELHRLRLLVEHGLLDTTPDPVFDQLAWLASAICGTPISLVSFVDADVQVFKARLGVATTGTSRCVSICAHAICGREIFVVPDTLADPRFAEMIQTMPEPHIRFYAGMPIVTADGVALGTICVADHEPRQLSPVHATMLENLARQAAAHITTLGPRTATADAAFRPLGWVA